MKLNTKIPQKDTSTHDMFVDLAWFVAHYAGFLALLFIIAWLLGFTPDIAMNSMVLIGMIVYKAWVKPMWEAKS